VPEGHSKILDAEAVGKECEALEGELAALRAAYEQYFLGMERHPPVEAHKQVRARAERLKQGFVRQTVAKFKVSTLYQKLLTYERLWERTVREIESGTYRRDVFKARMHARQRPGERPADKPKPAAQPAYLSDEMLRKVYDALVKAKKQVKEDVSRLTFDGLAAQLRRHVPEVVRQFKAKSIEYKIVIKDGKPIVKAIPK